eukprot:GEMP01051016.1.p1 GENE.GEMP01051016.1~~GEMP01051016.1.p1  ORF type:complete len:107 (-),score=1.13 GEMP01051016.1:652-972(-)
MHIGRETNLNFVLHHFIKKAIDGYKGGANLAQISIRNTVCCNNNAKIIPFHKETIDGYIWLPVPNPPNCARQTRGKCATPCSVRNGRNARQQKNAVYNVYRRNKNT